MKKIISMAILGLTIFLSACTTATPSAVSANVEEKDDFPKYAKVDTESLDLYQQVAQVLENCENIELVEPSVEKNTVAHYHKENMVIHESNKAEVALNRSVGFPFVEIVSKKKGNPFVGFNALVDNGLVEHRKEDGKNLSDDGVEFDFEVPDLTLSTLDLKSPLVSVEKKSFEYSKQGCTELADRIVMLAKTAEGNYNSLACNGYSPVMHYSETDDCYYCFVMHYDTNRAYVTAVYMTSDDGMSITDVMMQYMFIQFPLTNISAGIGIPAHRARLGSRFEMITLLTATEQALTGDCYFASQADIPCNHYQVSYVVPDEYQVGDYTANLIKDEYETELCEIFEMYTYSIGLE